MAAVSPVKPVDSHRNVEMRRSRGLGLLRRGFESRLRHVCSLSLIAMKHIVLLFHVRAGLFPSSRK
jgi:hypothetical protein